jgi:hypothetical protein
MQSACFACFLVPAAAEVPSKADREAGLRNCCRDGPIFRPNETFIQVERTGSRQCLLHPDLAYGIVDDISKVGERLARWLLMAQPAWAVTGYLVGVAPAGEGGAAATTKLFPA